MGVVPPLLSRLMNRRIGVILLLGFASGLPLELTGQTLQLWLAEGVDKAALAMMALVPGAPDPAGLPRIAEVEGIDLSVIALFSLIGLPYVFKMLWAPLMDRYVPPLLGRRRGWMAVTQLLCAGALVGMALSSPRDSAWTLAFFALIVAFASASQDIVIDAYRTDVLTHEERGFGAAVFVMAYRLAMLVAGGIGAILGDQIGWSTTYLVMAAIMGVGLIGTWLAPPPAQVVKPPATLVAAVVDPLREFLSRRSALWLLVLIVLYKLADAFAASLFSAFLYKGCGFTPTEIGVVRKGVGFFAVMGGMFVGGIAMVRLGLYRSLMVFGVLMILTNLVFVALAEAGHDHTLMVASIIAENVAGGMGTAAFVALLMALCDTRFTATQYALLSALAALGRVIIGPLAGPAVESLGWSGFFIVSAALGVPTLLLLRWLRDVIHERDAPPSSGDKAVG